MTISIPVLIAIILIPLFLGYVQGYHEGESVYKDIFTDMAIRQYFEDKNK